MHEQNPGAEGTNNYRTKMRSLYLNLKAQNNPGLREDVVSGEIGVARLYGMTPAVSTPLSRRYYVRGLIGWWALGNGIGGATSCES